MNRTIVALIDDDEIYQFVTRKIANLNSAVSQTLQFHNGQEAINYIRDNRQSPEMLPALILLDINMPYLNGWQFLEELQGLAMNTYHPDIYLVSSSANKEDMLRAEQYPILRSYLVKPITKEVFDKLLSQPPRAN
jgi:CheY-like chemotaxis protein